MSFTTIAFRNIPRRKLRNALTILAVILGVALVVGVNISFESVYGQFQDTISQALGNVDINVRSKLYVPIDHEVLSTIMEIDNVVEASARITGRVQLSVPDSWVDATLFGIDSSSDFDYLDDQSNNITGIKDLRINSTDAVVSEGLNYTIGDEIEMNVTIITDQVPQSTIYLFNVVGIYHPDPIIAEFIGQRIYVDIVKAQNLFEYGNEFDTIIIKITNIKQTHQVVRELNSELGDDYIIDPVKIGLINTVDEALSGFKSGLQIMSVMCLCVAIVIVLNTIYMNVGERTREIGILRAQGSSTRQVFWMFFSESLFLGVIGAIIGLFVGIALTNVFSYITSQIFQSFNMPMFTTKLSLDPATIQTLTLGASTGLIAAVIGGIFPSLQACRIDVIKALRPSMRKGGKSRTALKLVVIGLPLTIFGMFIYLLFDYITELVGLGTGTILVSFSAPIPMIGTTLLMAGLLRSAGPIIERLLIPLGGNRRLISRNVERNLLRSTICFGLIGISLSFVIVMQGAQNGVVMGVENVIRSFSSSDITVSLRDVSDPISRSFADNLTQIEGGDLISVTSPALIVPTRVLLQNNMTSSIKNSSSSVMTIDPITYSVAMQMTFSEDTPPNVFDKVNRSGTIILTSPLANSLNVTINDTVQMGISIKTPFGYVMGWKDFRVVGVAVGAWLDLMSFGGFPLNEASYISYNSLNDTFPIYDDMSNMFFIKVEPDQDVKYIRDQIRDLYGDEYDFSISTYNDAAEMVSSSIDQIFYILNTVVLFAVLNASIGVMAISIMNISERRREIGILRSQGMSKFQIIVLILGEVIVLGIVGFFLSVVIGMTFHRITVSYMAVTGFPMPYIVPYNAFGISLILALFTSLISAIYPANRATKINIVDALRRTI